MEIKGLGMADLLHIKVETQPKVLAREVIPELKETEVKVDISKEGMEALRKQVQEMPGSVDMEEWIKTREILPKLQMDPAGTHFFQMAQYEGELLEKVKEVKGEEYTVEDIRGIQVKAYERYKKELEEVYGKGEREIYISNGLVDGKMQYHKVTKEEDFEYLKQAYERLQRKVDIFEMIQNNKFELRLK